MKKMKLKLDKMGKVFVTLWGIMVLAIIVFWGSVFYIAYHFITKWW